MTPPMHSSHKAMSRLRAVPRSTDVVTIKSSGTRGITCGAAASRKRRPSINNGRVFAPRHAFWNGSECTAPPSFARVSPYCVDSAIADSPGRRCPGVHHRDGFGTHRLIAECRRGDTTELRTPESSRECRVSLLDLARRLLVRIRSCKSCASASTNTRPRQLLQNYKHP